MILHPVTTASGFSVLGRPHLGPPFPMNLNVCLTPDILIGGQGLQPYTVAIELRRLSNSNPVPDWRFSAKLVQAAASVSFTIECRLRRNVLPFTVRIMAQGPLQLPDGSMVEVWVSTLFSAPLVKVRARSREAAEALLENERHKHEHDDQYGR